MTEKTLNRSWSISLSRIRNCLCKEGTIFSDGDYFNHLDRLLFGDKVLANQLLVEHVEEVVKVLLQELIGENLVPKD